MAGALGESRFPALAAPLALRGHRFRNRLVTGPLCTMYAAPDGAVTPRLLEYYRARARGGAGGVIVEMTFIDTAGSRAFHAQLGADDDHKIPGLGDLAEAIRLEGALAGIQLGHCGAQRVLGKPPVLAPSAIPWAPGKPVPQAMTAAEIETLLADFAAAAGRCVDAGFDLVELHGAHGYIINAFLNPVANRRADRYGGSPENRLRFAVELVERVRARIGRDALLGIRMNGDDLMEGGLGATEYAVVARALVAAGIDLVHVSAGTYRAMELRVTPMYLPEAPFVVYAEQLKAAVDVPVIAAGSIHAPETAEAILAAGKADLVAMSRPFLADPGLAGKILAGDTRRIVPCVRCNTCVTREQAGLRAYCAVNPETGSEWERRPPRSAAPRHVLVAGSGPSGVAAALAAARRGHRVTLAERATVLGGQIALAAALAFKRPLRRWLDWAPVALEDAGVAVRLATTVDAGFLAALAPDALIEATGAPWPVPDGFAGARDPLEALALPGRLRHRVAVVGAGQIGAETAWHLATTGCAVTLVEAGAGFGRDVDLIARIALVPALAAAGVATRFSTRATSFAAGRLGLETATGPETLAVEDVVVAFRRPDPAPVPPVDGGGIPTYVVGERAGGRGLYWAGRTGVRAGNLV